MKSSFAAFDAWMARHPLAYASLVVAGVCLVLALFVDLPLLLHLQSAAWQALRPVFHIIDNLGRVEGYLIVAVLTYVSCLVVAWRRRGETDPQAWYRRIARHCLLYFAALATTAAAIHLLKSFVARPRPGSLLQEGYGLGAPFTGSPWDSFPSGHAQVAFVTAAVLASLAPRWAPAFYLLAALAAAARVVTGWHYLSDTVASAFIAVVVVRLLARVFLDPARSWPARSPLAWVRKPR
jgi:membrane-associated phospholipid phosphatase